MNNELVIIGAGPAGLTAAREAASHGVKVLVLDENDRPGGQLFTQTHKFFGSKEHMARRQRLPDRDSSFLRTLQSLMWKYL